MEREARKFWGAQLLEVLTVGLDIALRSCFEMVAEVCYKKIFLGFCSRNEGA